MKLQLEHRASESPYIARVWRDLSEQTAEQMTSVAYARWDLVFSEVDNQIRATIIGPESGPRQVPVPDGTKSFGINFEFGTVLPQLPATRRVDGVTQLPDVSRRAFHLAGSSWPTPTYDNAEGLVAALVREGVLIRDPLVTELHRGASTDLSARTVQRRFLATSGLTPNIARQIDRARNAAVLLREGVMITEVVAELGFYDHAHLVRVLRRYIGRTPTELQAGTRQPLSLLYKT